MVRSVAEPDAPTNRSLRRLGPPPPCPGPHPRRGILLLCALFSLACGAVACHSASQLNLPEETPALHRAAATGDLTAVQRTLGQQVNQRGPYGWTPLHYAAIYNAPEVARFLLSKGARLNSLDQTSMTPLHWAARKGHREVVELLLQKGAEVMARNVFDMTPLHEASSRGVAELLIKAGAKLDAQDIDGMTPLHTSPSRETAQYLIKKGGNTNARAKDGRTPMDMPPVPKPRIP